MFCAAQVRVAAIFLPGFSRLDDHSATVDVAEIDLHSSDPHPR
jgi:hypothetical protein